MGFSVDSYGANLFAEVKCYNSQFSPCHLLKNILAKPGEVIISTYSLPGVDAIYPAALSVRSYNVTIIANSNFEEQAKRLKAEFPTLKIYLNPRAHAKMILSPGHVWITSQNLSNCLANEGTIGIASPVAHAFYKQ